MIVYILLSAAAVIAAAAAGYWACRTKLQPQLDASLSARENDRLAAEAQKNLLLRQLEEQKQLFSEQMQTQQNASLSARESDRLAAENQKALLLRQLEEQKQLFSEQMQKQKELQETTAQKQYEHLKSEFQILAEKILTERSEAFAINGKNQIDAVLAPLKVKLDEFKLNAENARKQTLETNARLSEQIQLLMQSSRTLGEEASQLAKALRSDNKVQGNWGEMILDEILASSGLQENVHYQKQATLTDDTGNALRNEETNSIMRPDVLVNYPDGKVVIIDSKVSLTNYIDWVNSEDENSRAEALRSHLRSVRSHVDELVRKNYSAYVKKSKQEAMDFVIMFMPNEGAYELAMRQDIKLWQYAFSNKVLIVSPVNLMALLQLIHLSWKRYDQERNQLLIVDGAAQLLDRLYSFYQEFDEIGHKLEQSLDVYRKATDRLRGSGGKRSVVKKGEELKALGIKMKRKLELPSSLQLAETIPDGSPGEATDEPPELTFNDK